MKRSLSFIFSCMFLIAMTACHSSSNSMDQVEINLGTSNSFTEEEIQQAIDIVLKDFFEDAEHVELHSLSYDEDLSNKQKETYGTMDVEPNNEIIISSDFYVDKNAGGAWNPDSDYSWIFVLYREDEHSNWILDDWGY